MIGQKFQTRHCGEIEVVGKTSNFRKRWRIRFLNTGFEKDVGYWQVVSGQVVDPYAPAVNGIGITGEVDYKKYGKLASVWRHVIYRCTDPKRKDYKRYGGSGVTICKEWLFLPTFIEDVTNLPGFDWDKFNKGLLQLDKDTKQRFKENKIYSKETCVWLPIHDNVTIQDGQMKPFIATDPSGYSEVFCNITDFARNHSELGFTRKNVSAVLNRSDVHSCFGWKFKYVDPNEEIVRALDKTT